MTEDWTKQWERRIVSGVYPLRRFLGRSDHSVVFLTECKAQGIAEAAIKILPPKPALIEAQLAHWRRLAALSHPHLIRLLDSGRKQGEQVATHQLRRVRASDADGGDQPTTPVVLLDMLGGTYWRGWEDFVMNHVATGGFVTPGDEVFWLNTDSVADSDSGAHSVADTCADSRADSCTCSLTDTFGDRSDSVDVHG